MAAPPTSFRPQLALLVKTAPDGPDWFHEIKYDGYRIGCRVDRRNVTLYSRNNRDWTAAFPEVCEAAKKLPVKSAFLDGEVAIVLPDGRTSFQGLQNAIGGRGRAGLVYFVFDLLYLDGEDLCKQPLEERKKRLHHLLSRAPRSIFRYSEHVAGHGDELFKKACALKLEGIVSKRRDMSYEAGRHESWVKTKCVSRQEFVIGGYTDPEGARVGIGALLIGYYDESGRLIFAGKAGTGFTNKSSVEIRKRLEAISQPKTPFAEGLDRWLANHAHWVRPELVCEVSFTEWTGDGKIRHPSFQGLRVDKPATSIRKEQAVPPPRETVTEKTSPPKLPASATLRDSHPARVAPAVRRSAIERNVRGGGKPRGHTPRAGSVVAGINITHPERVMYPELGLTKLDLARYYEAVAERMLPHVKGRPLTLVRCGAGLTTGQMRDDCIFMKHSKVWAHEALRRVNIKERTKIGEYLIADTEEAIVSLIQMDILEIHTWNATFEHVEQPDRVVFDIDPGPEVSWGWVVEAARLVRSVLEALRLACFVKTTGGAGLHIVVPIAPSLDWDECLEFSRRVSAAIVRTDPARYTMSFPKLGRERKLLIDYLRNNRTNTSIAAFSTRARPKATVSMPIAWDELTPRLRPDRFNVQTATMRLSKLKVDPWKEYFKSRQKITAATLKALGSLE